MYSFIKTGTITLRIYLGRSVSQAQILVSSLSYVRVRKSLKIKFALKSTGKSLKSLEKSLNSKIYCRT